MQRIAGVELSDTRLSATIIESGFRSARILKSLELSLPANKEERESLIADAFTSIKKEYSPKGAVLGIPLKYFTCHAIEIPAMSRSDVRKALLYEMEKYLPLPVDEYIIDFVIKPAGKDKISVFVASVKNTVVLDIIKLLQSYDIAILAVRCSAFSAVSSSIDSSGRKKLTGIFLYSSDNTYDIVVVENSSPIFFKSFDDAAMAGYEIEKHRDLHKGIINVIGNTVYEFTKDLVVKNHHLSISRSLAFSGVKKPLIDFNFTPYSYHKQNIEYYPYILGGLSVVAVVLFLLTSLIAYYKDYRTLQSIESQISSIEEKASAVLQERKRLDQMEKERVFFADFQGRSSIAIKVLSELSRSLPDEAWLVNFTIDDRGLIEIEGFAKKTSDMVIALEKTGLFQNISFTSPIVSKEGEERFAIKMEVSLP